MIKLDFLDFLDAAIMTPLSNFMEILNSESISDYFFGGSVTLLGVLTTFFVGWLLIRFILAPVRLSSRGADNIVNRLGD